jgi:hypothetical protein
MGQLEPDTQGRHHAQGDSVPGLDLARVLFSSYSVCFISSSRSETEFVKFYLFETDAVLRPRL